MLRYFCFYSRSTANLLAAIAYRISRVLKISGATQALVLDISQAFYAVCHTSLVYKFRYMTIEKFVLPY